MAFVLDKNGEYYPVFGGESSRTFLAADTTLRIKPNGGDGKRTFPTLKAAFEFIEGKWSNGNIIIRVPAEEVTEDEAFEVDGMLFNIPRITIRGEGVNQSTISFSNDEDISMNFIKCCVYIRNVAIQNTSNGNLAIGIASTNASVYLRDVDFFDMDTAIKATSNGNIHFASNVGFTDCTTAIVSAIGGSITSKSGCPITIENATDGFVAENGGSITLGSVIPTLTNVTNAINSNVGEATSNGYIAGIIIT